MLLWLALLLHSAGSTVDVEVNGDDELCQESGIPCRTIVRAIELAGPKGAVFIGPGVFSGAGNCNVTVHQPVSITGRAGPDLTHVNCRNASRALMIIAPVNITGVTFSSGRAPQAPALELPDDLVAGIRSSLNISATLRNVNPGLGGGLLVIGSEVRVVGCVISNCSARYGGGVALINASASFHRVSILGNAAQFGGGLYSDGGSLVLTGCSFRFNLVTAPPPRFFAGGAALWTTSDTTLTASSLIQNFASGFYLRGVGVYCSGRISVASCHIDSNQATPGGQLFGGGLYAHLANILLRNTSLSYNVADRFVIGGGAHFSVSVVLATSIAVVGNTILGEGDGAGLFQGGGEVLVENSTLTANVVRAFWEQELAAGGGLLASGGRTWIVRSSLTSNILHCPTARGAGLAFVAGNVGMVFESVVQNNTIVAKRMSGSTRAAGAGVFCAPYRVRSFMSHARGERFFSLVFSIVDRNHVVASSPLGGGVHIDGLDAAIVSSSVSQNSVSGRDAAGGGVFATSTRNRTLILTKCTIEGNYIWGVSEGIALPKGRGGGVCCGGVNVAFNSSFVQRNAIIASEGSGGGAYFIPSWITHFSAPLFVHAVFFHFDSGALNFNLVNSSDMARGGGLLVENPSAKSSKLFLQVAVSRAAVGHNSGLCQKLGCRAEGGGVFIEGQGVKTVSLQHCMIQENVLFSSGHLSRSRGAGAFLSQVLVSVLSDVTVGHNFEHSANLCFGAGLYVSGGDTVLNGIVFAANRERGFESSGGALSAFRATIRVGSCSFVSNQASAGSGSSFGGSIDLYGGFMDVKNSLFLNNSAGSGAAIALTAVAELQAHNATFLANRAEGVGGALKATRGARFFLATSRLLNNSALLASHIFGESLGAGALFRTRLSQAPGQPVPAVVQGQGLDLFNETVWATRDTGWLIDVENSESSVTVRFLECPYSSYLLNHSDNVAPLACAPCPVGAVCNGGSNVSTTQSVWGLQDSSGLLEMNRCPDGFCCQRSTCHPYNFCPSNRSGLLCGWCKAGFSVSVGSFACVPSEDCRAATWLVPVTVLSAGVVTSFWLLLRRRMTKRVVANPKVDVSTGFAEASITVFFLQVLPLTLSEESRQRLPGLVMSVFVVANAELNESASVAGWCPFAGFSPLHKIVSLYLVPLCCVFWIAVFCVCHAIFRFRIQAHGAYRGFATHLVALQGIMTFTYSTLVRTTVQFLHCRHVGAKLLLFQAPEIECFQPWQLVLMISVLPILLVYPLLMAWLVRFLMARVRKAPERRHVSARCVTFALTRRYERVGITKYWEAVLLGQRLLFIMIWTFTSRLLVKLWTFALCLLIMLVSHMLVQPYATRRHNNLMTLCLCGLLFQTILESTSAAFDSQSLSRPDWLVAANDTLDPLILCIPVAAAVFSVLRTIVIERRRVAVFLRLTTFSVPYPPPPSLLTEPSWELGLAAPSRSESPSNTSDSGGEWDTSVLDHDRGVAYC